MASAKKHLFRVLLVSGLLSLGLGACSSDSGESTASTGGNGGSGSDSESSSGGSSSSDSSASSSGNKAGSTSSSSSSSSKGGDSGGAKTSESSSGGSSATSSKSSSGGSSAESTAKGGSGGKGGTGGGKGGSGGGKGGAGAGGTGDKGGTSGNVGGTSAEGGTSAAAGSSGTVPTGGCQKGGFKGSDLVIFGESFYDWNPPHIKNRLEELARKAGSLGASDKYRQYAVAGQNMNYIANTEYNNAVKDGKFTKVVMDGGGIDCMNSSCPSCPDTFKGMLEKMAKQGADQVIYTRYPEPGNPPGSNANLKKNLDALMPKMQEVCKAGATGLKCYWVDLVPLWPAERDKYTTDGLHPTKTGGDVVGDAIWAEMVKQCMAQ